MNAPLPANRADGVVRATFTAVGGRTAPARVYAGGGLRLRCPRVGPGLRPDCEAVVINTAGGMVGGDRARLAFSAGPEAAVTVTSQSAEKIYRSTGVATRVEVALDLAPRALLEWLPQETILFDRTDLRRRLDANLAPDATLLAAEQIVFGRLAMGETVTEGTLRDRWRVRRGGALVFAEELALAGPLAALLDRPALGRGARALATVLLVAPDAERRLEAARNALGGAEADVVAGASAWNGLLLARLLSPSPGLLRAAMLALLATLRGRNPPRVWQ